MGSGFDVCSAVFGSTEFIRAPKATLEGHMSLLQGLLKREDGDGDGDDDRDIDEDEGRGKKGAQNLEGVAASGGGESGGIVKDERGGDPLLLDALATAFQEDWGFSVKPLSLPPGLDLAMGDVNGGSETPSMVRKVLSWRESGGEAAARTWADL